MEYKLDIITELSCRSHILYPGGAMEVGHR
jgi:hypothetical protein